MLSPVESSTSGSGFKSHRHPTTLFSIPNSDIQTDGQTDSDIPPIPGDASGPPAKLKKQTTIQKAMDAMAKDVKAEAKSNKNRSYKIDEHFGIGGLRVLFPIRWTSDRTFHPPYCHEMGPVLA